MKNLLLFLTMAATLCAAELKYRFEDHPPSPDFYDRSHVVEAGPVRDATQRDSDEVIGKNPMRLRGFKIGWLRDGQRVGVLRAPTVVTMVDASGGSTRVTLKAGEPVVYDEDSGEVLAVNRCANKVTTGLMQLERARLPEPQPLPPRVSTLDVNFPTEFAANVALSGQARFNHDGTVTLRHEGGQRLVTKQELDTSQKFNNYAGGAMKLAFGYAAVRFSHTLIPGWERVARINATRGPQNVNVFKPTNTFEPPDVNVNNTNTNTAQGGAGGAGGNANATGGAGGAGGTGVGVGGNANANANAGASAGANTPPPPVVIPPPPRPPHQPPVHVPPPPPPSCPAGTFRTPFGDCKPIGVPPTPQPGRPTNPR